MNSPSKEKLIDQFVVGANCLNAIPENSIRILNLLTDTNFNMRALLRLIEQEPAIAARIITVVNSAAYARSNRITQLEKATVYLGVNVIREIVSATMLKTLCQSGNIGKYSAINLWEHCVGVAVASRELALRATGVDPQTAFLAGILHDIGLLLYVQSAVQTAGEIFAEAEDPQLPFTQIEKGYFGFDHCELGDRVAQAWKFPEELIAACSLHHTPSTSPRDFRQLCALIFIADTLCAEAEIGFSLTCGLQKISDDVLRDASLSRADVAHVNAHLKVALRLHLN